jgi:3-hydroxymyristoyl/3-hydroxydecanoyl-(acyl carrier protein) dehydratase
MKPLIVAADHPMLPGHFPGRPIVPGAYLLSWAIAQAREWLAPRVQMRVVGVRSVKFTHPVAPGQTVAAAFALSADTLKFSLLLDGEQCAVGALELLPAIAASADGIAQSDQ